MDDQAQYDKIMERKYCYPDLKDRTEWTVVQEAPYSVRVAKTTREQGEAAAKEYSRWDHPHFDIDASYWVPKKYVKLKNPNSGVQ